MSTISLSTLSQLGRRIERLLYFGILLVFVCFIEWYLVSASIAFSNERNTHISKLISVIEDKREYLSSLFKERPSQEEMQREATRELQVAETRKLLGLPPKDAMADQAEKYKEALTEILTNAAKATNTNSQDLSGLLDYTVPPEEQIKRLQNEQKGIDEKTIQIWGLETPRLFSISYGDIRYRVPPIFLSTTLLFLLAPLLLGWLGSFYITRQRELMMISTLDESKFAFPHVLNILPLNPVELNRKLGLNRRHKGAHLIMAFYRHTLSLFRSFVILLFAIPMVFVFAHSTFSILQIHEPTHIFIEVPLIATTILLALETILLVSQEWILLHKKEFFD